ncbi:MAG: hypothetical protein ACHQ1G_07230 [Planctomycetota bacterium]
MTTRWAVLLVAVTALLVHAPANWGEFVFHDDYRYVVNNPAIDRVGDPLRFFTDLSTLSEQSPTADIYRPVRTLSYAAITALRGKESAAPFHKLAILLHAGTAVLLLLLLRRAGLGPFAASAGALFFALSPVTVEVTAWVCSLGDSWCGFLAVASVLAYAADRRVLACVALVLALFSKEHAVVVPGLWLAWDAFLRPERLRVGAWRRTLLLGAAPAAALVAAFLLFRTGVGAKTSQVSEPIGGSYGVAACTMLAGLGWYAATILFPYGPTFDAVVELRPTPLDAGAFLGLLVIATLVWALLRGPARVRLAAAWFLLALVPVHNVFVSLKIPTADRFLYLPLMGLAFAVGELAQRTYPFSAKWMAPALVLLGVLSVARIGDWKDSEALVAAGRRVTPKSHRLIWEEAAIHAERAQRYLMRGDAVSASQLADRAVASYELYLKNSYPAEQTQAYVELGDLLFAVGRALPEPERRREQGALRAYLAARGLQRRGVGRVTEEEMRHVAERIVVLAVDLVPREKPGPTIAAGLEAAHFLKEKYGIDDTGARVVFRLADSVRVRGDEPAEARKGFTWVLEAVEGLEKKGARLPFIKAQALYYRAVLRDQDFNLTDLEQAYLLYVEAAKDTAQRLRAFAYAGRCACTIGSLFGDAGATERGKRLLRSIPALAAEERLRLDPELAKEIASLEHTCGR